MRTEIHYDLKGRFISIEKELIMIAKVAISLIILVSVAFPLGIDQSKNPAFELLGKVVKLSGDVEGLGIVKAYEKRVFISIVPIIGEEERQIRLVGRYKIALLASNKNEYTELSARNEIIETIVEDTFKLSPQKDVSLPATDRERVTQDLPVSLSRPSSGSGYFLEFSLPSNSLGGDQFDGQKFLSDDEEFIIMPKFEKALGWGIGLGKRFSQTSIILRYFRTVHNINFEGIDGKATYGGLGIEGQRRFFIKSPVQPYISLGCHYARIVVDEGAMTLNSVADAKFSGLGLDGGFGLTVNPTPRLYISGGPLFRFLLIGWVKGVMGVTKTVGDMMHDKWERYFGTISTGGLGFQLAVGYVF